MTPPSPSPQPAGSPSSEDIDRVREIILGPDRSQTRLQQAEIDRLRTILFGAQMESYGKTFDDLTHVLEQVRRDLAQLQDRVLLLEQAQARRVDALEQEVRRLADSQRRSLERQRGRDEQLHSLQAQLQQQDLGRQALAAQVADLAIAHEREASEARALQGMVADYRDSADRQAQALRREIRQTDDSLRAELRRITDRLAHQKTDRTALAAIFAEVVARLETGETMTSTLETLGRAGND